MKNYVIQDSGSKIEVFGTIRHNGEVHIEINGEEYAILKISDGDYSEEPGCAELELNSGGYIKENPTSQEIKLPDGLHINKNIASKSVNLPSNKIRDSTTPKSSNNKKSVIKEIVKLIIKILK